MFANNKKKIISILLLLGIFLFVGKAASQMSFDSTYKIDQYRRAYLNSQYVGGPGLIPDNTVYLFAAGAYLEGISPLKINPEVPPLGIYILSLSIHIFQNTNYAIVAGGILSLSGLYLLGKVLFKKTYLALVPVLLFSSEMLFLDQFKLTPTLDIIQLPFIFFAFYFFYQAIAKQSNFYYISAGLALGFVMGIKVMITGILIGLSWMIFLFLRRDFRAATKIVFLTGPVSVLVLLVSYSRIFLDGYSLWYFLLVQKWVLLFQQSKILYPFSAWRLLLFNQWQAWWGDMRILHTEDWRITWPIITLLSLAFITYKLIKKTKWHPLELIIAIWIIIYSAFISLGTVSTRHFLPFLPFLYLLSTKVILMLKSNYNENSKETFN
jgi:hypothetical protein